MEETKHEKACEVFDQRRRDREDDEDQHCDGVDWTSTDDGDLAEGCKDQWSHAVGEDVEGERERSVGRRHAEFFDHSAFAGGVNRGAAVDGERIGADEPGDKAALAIRPILRVCGIVCRIPVY